MGRFDEVLERRGTSSVKFDGMATPFGRDELLPMWVADMDFKAPDCILEAVRKRCEHGIFGYSFRSDEAKDAFIAWVGERHGWRIEREMTMISPGICTALSIAVRVFTSIGEGVTIMTPVYHPFHEVVLRNKRTLHCSPLTLRNGRYEVDWVDFESKLAQSKLLIISNPHNPVGRVWDAQELKRMGELCLKHGVTILSDEIHSDLMLYNNKHTVMASLSKEIADITLTCMAPSKTFNIAGMLNSFVIAENREIYDKFNDEILTLHLDLGNLFGHITLEAAYRYGAEWLEELKVYLTESVEIAKRYVAEEISEISFIPPEGSFLLWLDFRGTGYSHEEVKRRLIERGGVALNDGLEFGREGEGFMRMNIGCPHSVLVEGLERIKKSMQK